MKTNSCVIAGSFNPFHLGHLYLITQAIKLGYNKVYVLISINEHKQQTTSLNQLKFDLINWLKYYQYQNQIKVLINESLTVEMMNKLNTNTIIRGYRNQTDYDYELNLKQQYLKAKPNLNFILIKTHQSLINLRSSNIRNKSK